MLWLLLTYIAFQAVYDGWGTDSVTSKVVYFAFQYGWVAVVAYYHSRRTPFNRRLYQIITLIMALLSLNELTWLNADAKTYAMMTSGLPAYGMSVVAIALFLCFILSKKLQWES